jgi:hypothetical protein
METQKLDREEESAEQIANSEAAAPPVKCVATRDAVGFASVFGVSLRPDPIERAAQVGRLCGIAAMLLRSTHPLVALLRNAERDDAALAGALEIVGALPTLTRRRLVATFGATQFI